MTVEWNAWNCEEGKHCRTFLIVGENWQHLLNVFDSHTILPIHSLHTLQRRNTKMVRDHIRACGSITRLGRVWKRTWMWNAV